MRRGAMEINVACVKLEEDMRSQRPHYATQNVPQEGANARQVGRRNEGAKLYTATAAENL